MTGRHRANMLSGCARLVAGQLERRDSQVVGEVLEGDLYWITYAHNCFRTVQQASDHAESALLDEFDIDEQIWHLVGESE